MADKIDILRAFGEEIRLRILRLLSAQELFVGELVEILQMPQPRVSRHLGTLRRLDLVRDRREGNWVYYRMDPQKLPPFARAIWDVIDGRALGEAFFPEDEIRLASVLAGRKDRTRTYFNEIAEQWDRIKARYVQDAMGFLIVANLVRPGSIAADIGAESGELLISLAATAGKVIGVDSSEKMLDACRRRVSAAGLGNVDLRQGDAESLPLADGECDTAFSSMLLHHLPDPAVGVREMARVVRPGGTVVLIDLVRHNHDWAREVMADLWLGFTEQQVRGFLAGAGLADAAWSASSVPSPAGGGPDEKLTVFIAAATKGRSDLAKDPIEYQDPQRHTEMRKGTTA